MHSLLKMVDLMVQRISSFNQFSIEFQREATPITSCVHFFHSHLQMFTGTMFMLRAPQHVVKRRFALQVALDDIAILAVKSRFHLCFPSLCHLPMPVCGTSTRSNAFSQEHGVLRFFSVFAGFSVDVHWIHWLRLSSSFDEHPQLEGLRSRDVYDD